jgi:hypothetical protein
MEQQYKVIEITVKRDLEVWNTNRRVIEFATDIIYITRLTGTAEAIYFSEIIPHSSTPINESFTTPSTLSRPSAAVSTH